LPEHKAALFKHLRERWENFFNLDFEVLLYDLTSTCFKCDPDYDGDGDARSTLEKMASIQMINVHQPTTNGRELRISRYTQPLPEHQIIPNKLKLKLPVKPKPGIYAKM